MAVTLLLVRFPTAVNAIRQPAAPGDLIGPDRLHFTVTLFARLRGLSGSWPRSSAR